MNQTQQNNRFRSDGGELEILISFVGFQSFFCSKCPVRCNLAAREAERYEEKLKRVH